jgi:hypothetical protein
VEETSLSWGHYELQKQAVEKETHGISSATLCMFLRGTWFE